MSSPVQWAEIFGIWRENSRLMDSKTKLTCFRIFVSVCFTQRCASIAWMMSSWWRKYRIKLSFRRRCSKSSSKSNHVSSIQQVRRKCHSTREWPVRSFTVFESQPIFHSKIRKRFLNFSGVWVVKIFIYWNWSTATINRFPLTKHDVITEASEGNHDREEIKIRWPSFFDFFLFFCRKSNSNWGGWGGSKG